MSKTQPKPEPKSYMGMVHDQKTHAMNPVIRRTTICDAPTIWFENTDLLGDGSEVKLAKPATRVTCPECREAIKEIQSYTSY